MDRTPSEENADDDATNKTPEPNPDELEDGADETAPPPDDDAINDSEPEPQSPPDAVDNIDEPDLENVADEQEGAPEEEAPEDSGELAEEESPEEVLIEENVEEVPLEALEDEGIQEAGTIENVEEGETGPPDEELAMEEEKLAESIIEFIEGEVLTDEKKLEESDSGHLAMLAEGIVTAIISSSVVPSVTGIIPRDQDEEMDVIPESMEVEQELREAGEEGAEDGIFPTPPKAKMVDKAVQAIAKEIDEALEALSEESLPLEEGGELEATKSAESGIASEGEAYQSCEEASEIAEEERPCGVGSEFEPCPYMEQIEGEIGEEEGGITVEAEDESQWEDLHEEGEEAPAPVLIEGAELTDQEGEFEAQETFAEGVPQDAGIPVAPTDTYTPSAEGEAPMVQDETYAPMAQAYTPGAPGETYTPSAAPVDAFAPSAPPESFTPKPSVAPDAVRRIESSGGIKPAPPPAEYVAPRAVASDTQRRPAAKTAVTPRREPGEGCEWGQAICSMTDQLFESPYNYICKFVVLCVAIRALRNIFQATRCS